MTNFLQDVPSLLMQGLNDVLSQSASFRLGNFEISASESQGNPVRLNYASAALAVFAALTGHSGSFQTGTTVISVGPYVPSSAPPAPVPVAAPASVTHTSATVTAQAEPAARPAGNDAMPAPQSAPSAPSANAPQATSENSGG